MMINRKKTLSFLIATQTLENRVIFLWRLNVRKPCCFYVDQTLDDYALFCSYRGFEECRKKYVLRVPLNDAIFKMEYLASNSFCFEVLSKVGVLSST